jgi:hypothetical protein
MHDQVDTMVVNQRCVALVRAPVVEIDASPHFA